ncbi:MAG TPA: sensor histidine kinase [Gammaproteobacteria bacterium]|nr:sensor histidine kinase [Gammaproteobacteria bacterium]
MNNPLSRTGRALFAPLLWLHHRLLPRDESVGWVPYLWLPYLSFFLLTGIVRQQTWPFWIAISLATVIFLFLYFRFYWAAIHERYRIFAAIALLGLVCLPINGQVFVMYAAGFCGFAESMRKSLLLLGGLLAAMMLEAFVLGMPYYFWVYALVFGVLLGLANAYFGELHRKNAVIRQSQEEIRRLAATAERERIGRDLHDLLGHTLTLITVKAELAAKLAERNLAGAVHEIREVETISRNALQQVREAVGGYRNGGLAGEIVNARIALDAANIALKECTLKAALPSEHDSLLSMVLREAITNVVRHSGARECRIRIETDRAHAALYVEDDGRGGGMKEGNGIHGMRERLRAFNGNLEIESNPLGTSLCASLPFMPQLPDNKDILVSD